MAQPFQLEIDNQPFEIDGCCRLLGLSKVFGFVTRGSSTLIPHLDGQDPNVKRIDQAVWGMEFVIYPWRDPDGDPYDDQLEGILTNVAYFRDFLAPTTVTKTAVIRQPSPLTDFTGEIQVEDFEVVREEGQTLITAFDLVLPAGEWTPVGS